jgi:hypothetical protein
MVDVVDFGRSHLSSHIRLSPISLCLYLSLHYALVSISYTRHLLPHFSHSKATRVLLRIRDGNQNKPLAQLSPAQPSPAQPLPPLSHLRSPTNLRIDPMSPTGEATILLVPALLGVRMALRTTMAIDTFRVVAFRLEIAGRHPGHLFQGFEIILGDVVVVVVRAAPVGAGVGAVQVVDVT